MKQICPHSFPKKVHFGSIFTTLLLAGAVLFSPGWGVHRAAAGTGFPTIAGDEQSFSIGVVQLTVDPAFAFLFAPDPTYYYPGYSPTSRVLTSPTMYDFSDTWIGVSAKHIRNKVAGTGFPATVGTPAKLPPPYDLVAGYSSYPAIPTAFDFMVDGVDEVVTEIESIKLTARTSAGFQCAPDPRVPAVSSPITIVRAGMLIPSLPLNRRSLGLVQQYPTNPPGPTDDFPAQSFFNIFVEVNLPYVMGNKSSLFPTSNPPGWDPGAVLYNDANNPLIIANPDVTSLPPTAVYIHGQSAAVPLKFRFSNPPYWAADDVIGYVVLAGHGVFPDAHESNACAKVAIVLDETLGPIGSSKPQMPVPWLRQTIVFPTTNSGYGSLINRVDDGSGIIILDDTVSFTNGLASTIFLRDINLGNLINPIAPPGPNGTTTYNAGNAFVICELSDDGVSYGTAADNGQVQMKITNTGTVGGTTTFDTEMLQLNLAGNGPIGPFMIRESPTKQSLGKHTIQPDPRGVRISSFFDVWLELSVNDGLDWIPANRSIRVTPSAPPAAPNSIFISQVGPNVVLNWQNEFALQSASIVTGPYTDVPGVFAGPYTTSISGSQKYFRLRQ